MNIILDKLNLGCNKKDMWAVAGTCRALKASLAQFPADIKLAIGVRFTGEMLEQNQIAGAGPLSPLNFNARKISVTVLNHSQNWVRLLLHG